MSRSYRKNAFDTYVCYSRSSMKAWRTQENRRLRHNAKQLVNNCEDYDELIIPVLNDYDTLWGSPQDGRKRYIPKPALNQCELDFHNSIKRHYSWIYYVENKTAEIVERVREQYKHEGKSCNCYSNKRGWYWKTRIK